MTPEEEQAARAMVDTDPTISWYRELANDARSDNEELLADIFDATAETLENLFMELAESEFRRFDLEDEVRDLRQRLQP
jgi:hypothetical protein